MISTRSKWLIGVATLAPLSLLTLFSANLYISHQMQMGNITPKEAVQTLVPWVPKLFTLTGLGGVFGVAALISLAADNRPQP